jgi:multiple sugar transport system permease protein
MASSFAARQKSKLKYNCKQVRLNWDAYLFLLPFALVFCLFTLAPVVTSLWYSFTYYNILEPATFIGFQNYINLFLNDEIFLIALKNTFLIAAITGPVGYLASLMLAWFINELKPMLRSIMVVVFYAPSISGAAYLIWTILFNGDTYGYVNAILLNLGVINAPIQWLTDVSYMMFVVILVQLWMSLGAGFLSFVAGFQGLDASLVEAGMIDGISNRWQELWFITLPSMRPQMMFGAVMSITSAFTIGDQTTALCGLPSTDYAVHTILNHLQDYGTVRYEMGYASAIATVLFLAMLVTNQLIQLLLRRVGK